MLTLSLINPPVDVDVSHRRNGEAWPWVELEAMHAFYRSQLGLISTLNVMFDLQYSCTLKLFTLPFTDKMSCLTFPVIWFRLCYEIFARCYLGGLHFTCSDIKSS